MGNTAMLGVMGVFAPTASPSTLVIPRKPAGIDGKVKKRPKPGGSFNR